MSRDEFSARTRARLAARAGYVCSFPGCGLITSGPSAEAHDAVVNLGEAAHICGAASGPGSRRYSPSMTGDERRSIENAIWLCRNCHRLVDSDESTYTAEDLRGWKKEAEERARLQLRHGRPSGSKPTQPALHQLPAPVADFTGREEDLETLHEWIAPSGRQLLICGLRGLAGVGKTQLALVLAQELAPRYPDAQLFVELDGTTKPRSSAEVLAEVIHAFEPQAQLPESVRELAGLYRSVLRGLRVLLVFDNAADASQVEPLVPPLGSLALVTSRKRFNLPGLKAHNLDALDQQQAVQLLVDIAPNIGAEAEPLAHLCGCLPLALRLAASTLANRSDLSPSDYRRRLEEGRERLDDVEAQLDLSFQLLESDASRERFAALSIFPGGFDAAAAAAVWKLDEPSPSLGELVTASLLEGSNGRYRFHDLVREFAERRLEDPQPAQRRHAAHYAQVLAAADERYLLGGEETLPALEDLDREWRNFQAGQAWAAEHWQQDERAAQLARDYPNAGIYLLDLRQSPQERIEWLEAALSGAREIGDRTGEGQALGNLGPAYVDLGEPRRAIELYELGLEIAREIGDRRGEGRVLGNLGNAYVALDDPHRAIELYEQRLAIAREIGDRRGEGAALGNLGVAYNNIGEPRRAIEFSELDLEIAREIGDRRGESQTLGNLGLAYAALGEPRRAIELYEQVLEIAHEIGDRRVETLASWYLGLELEKTGDLPRAVEVMNVRVSYLREVGHPNADEHAEQVEVIRSRIAADGAEERPFGIKLWTWLARAGVLVPLIVTILAALDIGTYELHGQVVSNVELLKGAWQ